MENSDPRIDKLANILLVEAFRVIATWMHIEPDGQRLRIRMRVDGELRVGQPPPVKLAKPLVGWFKERAGLDPSEARLPQLGGFEMTIGGRQRYVRVETIPSMDGEKLVLRFDDPEPWRIRGLDELGLGEKALTDLKAAMDKRRGLVLFAGPTNSGKNTTCYAMLGAMDREKLVVASVESAARSPLQGVHQSVVDEKLGWNQAAALRTLMRMDVDVVYTQELTDFETTELAIRMAIRGQLVLSTIHTSDAPKAIQRLVHMGFEPWQALDSVAMVVAQRLLPRLCTACKAPADVPRQALLDAGLRPDAPVLPRIYKPVGCDVCDDTGWRGQVLVEEHLNMREPTTAWSISQLVMAHASPQAVRSAAIAAGMRTMREAALMQVCDGETTLSEALIATPPVHG